MVPRPRKSPTGRYLRQWHPPIHNIPRDPHRQHQQGDEIACSCGKRWPVGEDHP